MYWYNKYNNIQEIIYRKNNNKGYIFFLCWYYVDKSITSVNIN